MLLDFSDRTRTGISKLICRCAQEKSFILSIDSEFESRPLFCISPILVRPNPNSPGSTSWDLIQWNTYEYVCTASWKKVMHVHNSFRKRCCLDRPYARSINPLCVKFATGKTGWAVHIIIARNRHVFCSPRGGYESNDENNRRKIKHFFEMVP